MVTPPEFRMPNANGKICKLRKALNGMKQSPCAWFERSRSAMIQSVSKHRQIICCFLNAMVQK